MTDLREAAQQALEALELALAPFPLDDIRCQKAADALRAALAEPVQEPGAWTGGRRMNKEEIIRMAREAGCLGPGEGGDPNGLWEPRGEENITELMFRFAHLVYEATFRDANIAASRTILDAAVLAEREACAKVCEGLDKKSADGEWGDYLAGWSDGTDDCAAAIRARGNP